MHEPTNSESLYSELVSGKVQDDYGKRQKKMFKNIYKGLSEVRIFMLPTLAYKTLQFLKH
jgi:hypothetical protein